MAQGVAYIKIAKIDGNGIDQSNSLKSLNTLVVPYSDVGNTTYNIQTRTEKENFFLYQVQYNGVIPVTTASLEYDYTGLVSTESVTGPTGLLTNPSWNIPLSSSISDPLNLLNSTNNTLSISTYPQKSIHFRLSGSVTYSGLSVLSGIKIGIFWNNYPGDNNALYDGGPEMIVASPGTTSNTNQPIDIQASVPINTIPPGSLIQVRAIRTGYSANRVSTFDPGITLFISSSAATGTEYTNIGLEPYFTTDFSRAFDCQPLLNNAQGERFNLFLQDVDYSTSTTQPVNYLAIQKNTATKATVPESNYTQLSSTNIRYNGSKIQSEKINLWTDTRDNIGTYGKSSPVDSLDTTIYEFQWGGGTNPEIQGFGGVKMGKLLSVNTKDSVRNINPSDGLREINIPVKMPIDVSPILWHRSSSISQSVSDYYYILNGNNPLNHEISMYVYPNNENASSSPTYPSTTKILTTEYSVPLKSTFIVTSSAHGVSSAYGTGFLARVERDAGASVYPQFSSSTPFTASYIRLFDNKSMNFLKSDYSPGQAILPTNILMTGSDHTYTPEFTTASFIPLAEQLNNGERWFATFYENLESPFDSTEIVPAYINGTPLGKKGVVEIVGIYQSDADAGTPYDTIMLLKDSLEFDTGSQAWFSGSDKSATGKIGAGGLGMLMWQARSPGENRYVLVQDIVTGGVGAGAFTSRFTTQEITQNFEHITKTFGSNPQ